MKNTIIFISATVTMLLLFVLGITQFSTSVQRNDTTGYKNTTACNYTNTLEPYEKRTNWNPDPAIYDDDTDFWLGDVF